MICTALLAIGIDLAPTAEPVCADVVEAAEAYHLPADVLVSVAWHESRLWPDVVHPESGAAGPLQVMPLLQTDAGLVDDGARIFRAWLDHEARACVEVPTVDELGAALCRYACGYRCEYPCRWATTRLALADRLALASLASSRLCGIKALYTGMSCSANSPSTVAHSASVRPSRSLARHHSAENLPLSASSINCL